MLRGHSSTYRLMYRAAVLLVAASIGLRTASAQTPAPSAAAPAATPARGAAAELEDRLDALLGKGMRMGERAAKKGYGIDLKKELGVDDNGLPVAAKPGANDAPPAAPSEDP